jgi:hypothetical protein
MHLMEAIACARWRTRLMILACATLFLNQPASADRIGTIGDWETWTNAFGKPYAVVKLPVSRTGVSDFSMQCGEPGKIKFGLTWYEDAGIPQKLIVDTPDQDTFALTIPASYPEIEGKEAERLLKLLLKEEATANAARAKSWTLIFFIDDPKKRGYSANVGGVKEVRDFLLKWCAAPDGAIVILLRSLS